jgi:hypothetical protein
MGFILFIVLLFAGYLALAVVIMFEEWFFKRKK